MHIISRYRYNILLINYQNITSALVNPNSIIVYSQYLYLVLKAVFYSLPFLILIEQYAYLKSSCIKILVPYKQSCNSSALSSAYQSLIITLLSLQQSITLYTSTMSFFSIKKSSIPTRDINSLIYSFFSALSIKAFSIFSLALKSTIIGLKGSSFSFISLIS